MTLYLDDDCTKMSLVKLLKSVGHSVTIPSDAGLMGASDPRHLMFAVTSGLVLLTKNHDDFEVLHRLVQAVGGKHSGMLVVRSDNDPSRDMKDRDIARAILNLEAAGVPIINEIHILNHWR